MDLKAETIRLIIQEKLLEYEDQLSVHTIGAVVEIGDGIARIHGLQSCKYGELLKFENDMYGMALNLEEDTVGAVLLNANADIKEGSIVYSTGQVVQVPVGDQLIGRVINPIGEPMDGKGDIQAIKYRPIESEAPSILDRQPVAHPLQTGLLAIDAMIPIGRGQRELIIGDRQTGKTAIAIDTILNQSDKNVICIYVAIGQKASTIAQIMNLFIEQNAMKYSIIVAATASDSAPMQYIAPYAGCAIAEEFMHQGKDVLIIYDDLSKHAVAYRTMSLLLRRPPGREAYPGDVFFLHSRLLERAARLRDDLGGGSITALPIIETMAGDISAYIPTNVISITDGQIYLENELFFAGVRPAVNVGLSVSRVAGAAQTKAMKKVSGRLRLDLAQYRELAIFAQFSSELDKSTQELLAQGERITEILKQTQHKPMSLEHQVALLYIVTKKMLLDIPVKLIKEFKFQFLDYIDVKHPEILKLIRDTKECNDDVQNMIDAAVLDFKNAFLTANR